MIFFIKHVSTQNSNMTLLLENFDTDDKLCVMQGTKRTSLRVIPNDEQEGTITLVYHIHWIGKY